MWLPIKSSVSTCFSILTPSFPFNRIHCVVALSIAIFPPLDPLLLLVYPQGFPLTLSVLLVTMLIAFVTSHLWPPIIFWPWLLLLPLLPPILTICPSDFFSLLCILRRDSLPLRSLLFHLIFLLIFYLLLLLLLQILIIFTMAILALCSFPVSVLLILLTFLLTPLFILPPVILL